MIFVIKESLLQFSSSANMFEILEMSVIKIMSSKYCFAVAPLPHGRWSLSFRTVSSMNFSVTAMGLPSWFDLLFLNTASNWQWCLSEVAP